MTTYDCIKAPGKGTGYEWIDRRGNILQVPDDSWDPVLKNDKGDQLREYLNHAGYDGPGDWNPR
jgi:hypothetical protein